MPYLYNGKRYRVHKSKRKPREKRLARLRQRLDAIQAVYVAFGYIRKADQRRALRIVRVLNLARALWWESAAILEREAQ